MLPLLQDHLTERWSHSWAASGQRLRPKTSVMPRNCVMWLCSTGR